MKKLTGIILVLSLVLSLCMVPQTAVSAEEAESYTYWDGLTSEPTSDLDGDGYLDITKPSQLAWVVKNGGSADGKYELLNDIWLNDMTVSIENGIPTVTRHSDGTVIAEKDLAATYEDWYTATVSGEFEGNGFVVHGLFQNFYTESANSKKTGLFPAVGEGFTVRNLGLEDTYITSNVTYRSGALIGYVEKANGSVDSCYVGESVYMYGGELGGLIGGGTLSGGEIFTLKNSYSLATLKHYDDDPKDNKGYYIVNGLIGDNWSWSTGVIENCFAISDTGLIRTGTAKNCVQITTTEADNCKGIGAVTAFDNFSDKFVTTENGFPTLKVFVKDYNEFSNFPLTGKYIEKGTGTVKDPYIIETAGQLRYCVGTFGESGKYYKLANDIYLNDVKNVNWATGAPVGDYEPNVWFTTKDNTAGTAYLGFNDTESIFKGHIDGNGYAVHGIYYRPLTDYDAEKYGTYTTGAGLVPAFSSGSVTNLTIKNSYISSGRFVGAISANTSAQVLLTNVMVDGTVTVYGGNSASYSSSAAGGFIGYVRGKSNTTLTNCGFAGKLTKPGGGHSWGLIGTHYNSTFTVNNSFSVGKAPLCSSTASTHGTTRNITVSNVYSTVAPTEWNTDATIGTVTGTITVVDAVTGEDALSDTNMATLDKTVWYAVKGGVVAPMLRSYGTTIGDVDENGKGVERTDEVALRSTLVGAENYLNTDYNRDETTNICDLVAVHNICKQKDDDWRSHPEDFKLLAFTFDDGPDDSSPSVTMQVADVLAENNGAGTFFYIGNSFNQANDPTVAKYVVNKGSEVANHSYTHSNADTMETMSDEDFKKEFDGANDLIKQHTGMTPKYWRGAGYAYSEKIYEHLEELNMPAIGCCTNLGSDWSGGTVTVDEIVDRLLEGLPDGAIIGAHSSSKTYVTPNALAIALPLLYQQGYRFCTLSELFEYKGVNYDDIPVHCYITRVETLADGTSKIHTQRRLYLDSWKTHPEDYKLLAFTFDDGPNTEKDTRMVDLFAKYKGSATMFVIGTNCSKRGYETLQYAINSGWDVGSHSMTHADAHTGSVSAGDYTELTYDELKKEITDMSAMLEANLTEADGTTPYNVALYRPPQIKVTDTMFKVCAEDDLAVIWASQDTYDWSSSYDEAARLQVLKDGVGTWIDGDVILGHIAQDTTYNGLAATLEDFYDAGYRFCSITELMEYRDIERSDISGKLNDVNGNKGMVDNLVKAATYGKAK